MTTSIDFDAIDGGQQLADFLNQPAIAKLLDDEMLALSSELTKQRERCQ